MLCQFRVSTRRIEWLHMIQSQVSTDVDECPFKIRTVRTEVKKTLLDVCWLQRCEPLADYMAFHWLSFSHSILSDKFFIWFFHAKFSTEFLQNFLQNFRSNFPSKFRPNFRSKILRQNFGRNFSGVSGGFGPRGASERHEDRERRQTLSYIFSPQILTAKNQSAGLVWSESIPTWNNSVILQIHLWVLEKHNGQQDWTWKVVTYEILRWLWKK